MDNIATVWKKISNLEISILTVYSRVKTKRSVHKGNNNLVSKCVSHGGVC